MDAITGAFAPMRNERVAGAVSLALGENVPGAGRNTTGPALAALRLPEGRRREVERESAPAAPHGRRKLWQISTRFHCSLLGVCLGLDEMRRLAARLGLRASAQVSDFDLHHQLVHLARSADRPGRRLHRHLEEKFAGPVRAFREYRDESALRAGWCDATEQEIDLGGAYWALLTHPSLSETLAREALGQVHMLSHVAASALRRVRNELARANAKLAEQERALERERNTRVRQARALERLAWRLAERDGAEPSCGGAPEPAGVPPCGRDHHGASASPVVPGDELAGGLRTRLEKSEHERRAWRRLYRRARRRIEALDRDSLRAPAPFPGLEPVSLVSGMPEGAPETAPEPSPPCDLAGRVVAYVGGLDRVVPKLRALTERCNGRFVHHDGGRQERAARIEESLAGSDVLVVPLDCVSHDASRRLKRCCRRQGKPILWLPKASVSAFEGALRQMAKPSEAA